jgi:hypothetical protein
MDFYNEVKKDGVLVACMALTRNNIVGNNINVTVALQNTRLDRGKVFDKIVVSMIKSCMSSLDFTKVDEVLNTDNITLIGHPYEKYLTFNNADIDKEPTFDSEDLRLLKIVYKVLVNNLLNV